MSGAGPDRWADGEFVEVDVEGRRLRLSNLGKVLWPEAGFTKGEMIDYYVRVAPVLLPHVAHRPITLRRFPDGVEGLSWYQTRCRGRPDWVPTRPVIGRTGEIQDYCVVNDLPSLVWVVNLACVEMHPFLAFEERLDEPAVVVFDLDPGPPAGLIECGRVALLVREVLADLRLVSFPKTSSSTGMHVYVPLNSPHTYEDTKPFTRAVARLLEKRHPDNVVEKQTRALRRGKVLVDWLQNDATRSTVAPYSLRATAWPTVSTPVTWEEVEQAVGEDRPEKLTFVPQDIPRRLETQGELFRPVLELTQTLPR
jgi:bifunctional non-homologous end joining protein LigD